MTEEIIGKNYNYLQLTAQTTPDCGSVARLFVLALKGIGADVIIISGNRSFFFGYL